MPKRRVPLDAVVIGAGAAGLAAARELSQAGLELAVLEARDRIGGRIHTLTVPGLPVPVELGAEFVHGEAEETLGIARAAGLAVVELPDTHVYARGGRIESVGDFWKAVEQALARIGRRARRAGRDLSFAEALAGLKLPAERRQMVIDFVEGYHAAHAERISARALGEGAEDGGDDPGADRQFRPVAGYAGLMSWLAAGLDPGRAELRLGTVAAEIAWERGGVSVRCANPQGVETGTLRARAALLAVPLGVLKAGVPRLVPAHRPSERALALLEAGHTFKIVLRFRESFWEAPGFLARRGATGRAALGLNFLHAHDARVPTWWTAAPVRAPTLVGWAGGTKAEALLEEPEPARVDAALDALCHALTVPRRLVDEQLAGWHAHDWRADPWSRGSYSYVGVGGGGAQRALGRGIRDTLFFAGEALSVDQTGTVAGAIATGRAAARKMVQILKR